MTKTMEQYWNSWYESGRIWGDDPCPSALMANEHFRRFGVVDVLVLGCGYGRNSLFFAEQGSRVTAFDVSDVAVGLAMEHAKEHKINVEYMVGDIFDQDFLPGRMFEGVYLSNVLHLFLEPERGALVDRITSLL